MRVLYIIWEKDKREWYPKCSTWSPSEIPQEVHKSKFMRVTGVQFNDEGEECKQG